jgi:hypothetical protein
VLLSALAWEHWWVRQSVILSEIESVLQSALALESQSVLP